MRWALVGLAVACAPISSEKGAAAEDTSNPGAPPDLATMAWSPTGLVPARDLRLAMIVPDDPEAAYLGSARSGLFATESVTGSAGFELLDGLGRHFYTPVVVPDSEPDMRLVSMGRVYWLSEDRGRTWVERTPIWPDEDVERWSGRDLITGIDSIGALVVLTDASGRVWWAEEWDGSFHEVGTIPAADSGGKHDGTGGDAAFWTVNGTAPLLLSDGAVLVARDGGSVYRSADRGESWTEVLTGAANRHAMWTGEGVVLVGTEAGVYTSLDQGQTFTLDPESPAHCVDISGVGPTLVLACDGQLWRGDADGYLPVEVSGEVLSVAVAPSDPERVLAGMVEGALWSEDGGLSFAAVDAGLALSDVYVVAPHPTQADVLLGGTYCSTGLVRSEDRGQTWSHLATSAHYVMLIRHAPSQPERVYVTNSPLPGHGDLQRSNDGGQTFEPVEIPDADVAHPHALAVHPEDANVVLLGTSWDLPSIPHTPVLYRSEDGGETWAEVPLALPESVGAILTAAFVPADPDTVLIGTGPGGQQHLSAARVGAAAVGSGAGLWISRSGAAAQRVRGGLSGDIVWDVGFAGGGTWLVGTEAGVYRSVDGRGEAWTSVLALSDAERVHLVVSPVHPDWVLVSTTERLWASTDAGATWAEHTGDLSDAMGLSDEMAWITEVDISSDGSTVYVASALKGAWRAQ